MSNKYRLLYMVSRYKNEAKSTTINNILFIFTLELIFFLMNPHIMYFVIFGFYLAISLFGLKKRLKDLDNDYKNFMKLYEIEEKEDLNK